MIPNFNINLIKILNNLQNKNRFVLGLSGGLDSMALLHLLKNFINENKELKIDLIPVIVDHNLRGESKNESKEVKKISESLGFKTKIRKITELKPSGNIQNWARIQRRNILFHNCVELSCNLILAQHFDDQVETLFMRLVKETALDGLTGMSTISTWNGISILRPLLSYKKKQIKDYVKSKEIKYFEDPSNINFKFERVKTRYFLDSLKNKLWPNIYHDLNNLSYLSSNLLNKTDFVFNSWAKKNILVSEIGAVRVNYQSLKTIFDRSNTLSVRIIGKIIQTVGGNEYPPKRKKTFDLLSSIFSVKFNKKTLGNVNILLSLNYIYFLRENRNLNYAVDIQKDKYHLFDGRFLVVSPIPGKLIKCCYETDCISLNKNNPFKKYNARINNTIPYLKTLEGKTIKPHLNIMKQNSVLYDRCKKNCFSLYFIDRILI